MLTDFLDRVLAVSVFLKFMFYMFNFVSIDGRLAAQAVRARVSVPARLGRQRSTSKRFRGRQWSKS